jgi:hypothetical protein
LFGFSAPFSDIDDPFIKRTLSADSFVFAIYSNGKQSISISHAISFAAP